MPNERAAFAHERILELLGENEYLTEEDEITITYTWGYGYEKLTVYDARNGGGSEYQGSYHPNGTCEGTGVCTWCGRTL